MSVGPVAKDFLYETEGPGVDCCAGGGGCFMPNLPVSFGPWNNLGPLVLVAIIALPIVLTVGLLYVLVASTIGEGAAAEKCRLQIKEIENGEATESGNKLQTLLKDRYYSASVNTFSLSTATLGFITLIATTALVIYVVHMEGAGYNRYYPEVMEKLTFLRDIVAKNLSIAGGAVFAGGFLTMGIYQAIRHCRNDELNKYRDELVIEFPK